MEIIIQPDALTASELAARFICKFIRQKPDAVLGLATGSTPLLLYKELCRSNQRERLDFSRVQTFNVDEYVGLPPEHPCSYRHYMEEKLFRHISIPAANTHMPDGQADDIEAGCDAYERRIQAAGGIDLQVLGIGSDGHIGYNDPVSSLGSRTRVKTLTKEKREEQAYAFGSLQEVPMYVVTMGITTIMESRQIVLLAFGAQKAEAIVHMVEGPVTSLVPASILQMHPRVKLFLDEGAATFLAQKEYYRWVFENRPVWQRW